MASTPVRLMTFEEYALLPNPPGGRYELHHGELVQVGYPKHPHKRAQRQLRRGLETTAGDAGVVQEEMPFRPLPEHECWGADVGYVSRERWDGIGDWLFGAPDLVIEVLSPSNSATEILDKRKICLENGAREFWTVNIELRQVEVSTPDGRSITYSSGQRIPLFFGGSLIVDDIFA